MEGSCAGDLGHEFKWTRGKSGQSLPIHVLLVVDHLAVEEVAHPLLIKQGFVGISPPRREPGAGHEAPPPAQLAIELFEQAAVAPDQH